MPRRPSDDRSYPNVDPDAGAPSLAAPRGPRSAISIPLSNLRALRLSFLAPRRCSRAFVLVASVALISLWVLRGILKPDHQRILDEHYGVPPRLQGSDSDAAAGADDFSSPLMHYEMDYVYGALAKGNPLSMDDLRGMVARTQGYYARDWSLNLGWNNMRFIIEASLLHAHLLNRTLVLPSFVYARGCEFAHDVCAAHAPQVDRYEDIERAEREALMARREGHAAPLAAGEGTPSSEGETVHPKWRIPIEYMLDLVHLRSSQPVVLVSEYLTLVGLDPAIELKSGRWGREMYANGNTWRAIPNAGWDGGVVLTPRFFRVDVLPSNILEHATNWTVEGGLIQEVLRVNRAGMDTFPVGVMEWEDVRGWLRGVGTVDVDDEDSLTESLRGAGLTVLHTFGRSRDSQPSKHVTEPSKQVVSSSKLRGLVDDFGGIPDTVLLVEGEIHVFRKAGFLRFTTAAASRALQTIALHSARPHPRVRELGDRIARAMDEHVQGRMWLAGHMRRGDAAELGWAHEDDIASDLKVTTDEFERGREALSHIKQSQDARAAPAPGVELDTNIWTRGLPRPGDPFFIATDERGAEALAYCRAQGALFARDLLSPSEQGLYGWATLFSDTVMLAEQVAMSQSAFFVGHRMSSVSGGTLNQRAARGMDVRTGVVV